MARDTCCPMYVTDGTGWLAPCDHFYRVWSVAWTGHEGKATSTLAVEDVHGRTWIHCTSQCSVFQSFTRPLELDGIFVRTLEGNTKLYLQVE